MEINNTSAFAPHLPPSEQTSTKSTTSGFQKLLSNFASGQEALPNGRTSSTGHTFPKNSYQEQTDEYSPVRQDPSDPRWRTNPDAVNISQWQAKFGETESWEARQARLDRDDAEKVMTDPAYAEKRAREDSQAMYLMVIPTDVFEAAVKSGDMSKITNGYALDDPNNPQLKMLAQRKELYEKLVGQGTSPIDIIRKLFEFNINQPDSYSDFLDTSDSYPRGYYRYAQQERLERFNNAIEHVRGEQRQTDTTTSDDRTVG